MPHLSACTLCGEARLEGEHLSRSGRCEFCIGAHHLLKKGWAKVHPTKPYDLDEAAQRFVLEHPGGATLDEVGRAIGLTRERTRQIEEAALEKLVKALRRRGVATRRDLSAAPDDDEGAPVALAVA